MSNLYTDTEGLIFGNQGIDFAAEYIFGQSALPAIVRKYQQILDTEPEVLFAMEGAALTTWEGTPIYYADPAGATPVYDVGDPVGGLLDLVTGEIKATQTTDSARPVLGESAVVFDGSSILYIDDPDTLTQPYQQGLLEGPSHILVATDLDDGVTETVGPVGWQDGSQFYLMQMRIDDDPPIFRHWRDLGTSSIIRAEANFPSDMYSPTVWSVSVSDRVSRVRAVGSVGSASSIQPDSGTDAVTNKIGIGGRSNGSGGRNFFVGEISQVAIYRDVLSDAVVDATFGAS